MLTSMSDNLFELRSAAKSAAETFYEASVIYYTSIEANTPEHEVSFSLKQCIFLGNKYKVVLYQLMDDLKSLKQTEGTTEIAKVEESIEQLEAELSKLNLALKSS